jgi:hypothetical protein
VSSKVNKGLSILIHGLVKVHDGQCGFGHVRLLRPTGPVAASGKSTIPHCYGNLDYRVWHCL